MMNEFKKAKEHYDNTPIPAELSDRVQAGIREGQARYRSQNRQSRTLRNQTSQSRQNPPNQRLRYQKSLSRRGKRGRRNRRIPCCRRNRWRNLLLTRRYLSAGRGQNLIREQKIRR